MLKPRYIKILVSIIVCAVLLSNTFGNIGDTAALQGSLSRVPMTLEASASHAKLVQESAFLDELAKDTWTYLHSDWATDNHLPWSWRSKTMVGGDYANPAEIGFHALSWLAAYNMQKSWSPDWATTESEINAILDRLRGWQTGSQAYQPNGPNAYNNSVFYQWYWISTNTRPEPVVGSNDGENHVVPSIDNAWLAASLITIREYAEANNHPQIAQKANAILGDMDFTIWYHYDTHRFSWGGVEDPQAGTQADYYSNENRIINFVARALGQLSEAEFQLSLDALTKPSASYDGITVESVAWDGSYFTYAGPALFIREVDTPYGRKTIIPATQAQVKYAGDQGYSAWGLSDSFDAGNGDYLQQGSLPVASPGLPETRPGLVTPHASILALITPLQSQALANLEDITSTFPCAYDPLYGFRDSIMANPGDTDYGECSSRFSALAQEWSFLSLADYDSGMIWDYFYRDIGVSTTHAEMYDSTWELAWSDEFNGSLLDSSNWTCEVGGGGWGNQELENYTNCPNATVANGELTITAKKGSGGFNCWYGACQYTSARLITKAKREFQYGRIEARMKLPSGQGLWPAFWTLGSNIDSVGWPASGEIDIMEHINNETITYGTAHWYEGGHASYGCSYSNIDPTRYHIYNIIWDSNSIKWHVDGMQYCEINIQSGVGGTEELQGPFFILLNLAVGGNWPGSPNASTVFPARMYVDYVRVYNMNTPKVASITRIFSNPVSANSVNFKVTFSEPVMGVDRDDFSLTTSLTGATISEVNGSGSVYTVTVDLVNSAGTVRLDVPGTASIVDLVGNPLDNLPFTSGETYTVEIVPFSSTAANDGWTLESSEYSSRANVRSASGNLLVGDNAKNRQYRSLLYFDTATLPDNAVITNVTLKIMQEGITGTDPFTTHGALFAEMKNSFFGKSPLENTDFQAVAYPKRSVGTFAFVSEPGWYELMLNPANFKYVNLKGVTQFRIRFTKDDDNDKLADFVSFYSGDDPTNPPQLIVEYTTP